MVGHGDRAAQALRRRERDRRVNGDNGTTETWHPLLELARTVAARHVKPDRRDLYLDPLHDDATSVAAVAILSGEDPEAAVCAFIRSERDWRARAMPILVDFAA